MISDIKTKLKKSYVDRVFDRGLLNTSYNRIFSYLTVKKGLTNVEANNIIEDTVNFIEILSNTNYNNTSKTRRYVKGFFKFVLSKFKRFRGVQSSN